MRRFLCVALACGAMLGVTGGCRSRGMEEIETRNRAIQDCILQDGHPHLGPDSTIFCSR